MVNDTVWYVAVSKANDYPAGEDDPLGTLAPEMMDAIMKIKYEL